MLTTVSIIKPKRPVGDGWVRLPNPAQWVTLGFGGEVWVHPETGLCVISAVEVAAAEGGIDKGPEYHISISLQLGLGAQRCTSADALWVVAQFGLDGAEEDNHVPNGVVRNFWRPVADRLVGLECACKAEEPAILENKGDFVWRGVTA